MQGPGFNLGHYKKKTLILYVLFKDYLSSRLLESWTCENVLIKSWCF